MVSRKKPRVDGKKDTNNQLEEVTTYVEPEETERNSPS